MLLQPQVILSEEGIAISLRYHPKNKLPQYLSLASCRMAELPRCCVPSCRSVEEIVKCEKQQATPSDDPLLQHQGHELGVVFVGLHDGGAQEVADRDGEGTGE